MASVLSGFSDRLFAMFAVECLRSSLLIKYTKKWYISIMQAYSKEHRDSWVKTWPGQVVLCVSQIFWTSEVHSAIIEGRIKKLWEELQVSIT